MQIVQLAINWQRGALEMSAEKEEEERRIRKYFFFSSSSSSGISQRTEEKAISETRLCHGYVKMMDFDISLSIRWLISRKSDKTPPFSLSSHPSANSPPFASPFVLHYPNFSIFFFFFFLGDFFLSYLVTWNPTTAALSFADKSEQSQDPNPLFFTLSTKLEWIH